MQDVRLVGSMAYSLLHLNGRPSKVGDRVLLVEATQTLRNGNSEVTIKKFPGLSHTMNDIMMQWAVPSSVKFQLRFPCPGSLDILRRGTKSARGPNTSFSHPDSLYHSLQVPSALDLCMASLRWRRASSRFCRFSIMVFRSSDSGIKSQMKRVAQRWINRPR